MCERSVNEAIYKKIRICLVPWTCTSVLIAMRNFKLPIRNCRLCLVVSSPALNGSANPQQPSPSLASFGVEPRSGLMEAVGSWWFVRALETVKEKYVFYSFFGDFFFCLEFSIFGDFFFCLEFSFFGDFFFAWNFHFVEIFKIFERFFQIFLKTFHNIVDFWKLKTGVFRLFLK